MDVKVSVVATTYNNANEILAFLKNISFQTYPVDEIVISDGGSSDETVSIILDYAKECSIKVVCRYGKRLNISEGYNDAIKNTKNNIIFIAGVGNQYSADVIELLVKKQIETDADVVCPWIYGVETDKISETYSVVYMKNKAGQDGTFGINHGSLIKKSIFFEMGFFYEHFVYAGEDAEYIQRLRENKAKIVTEKQAKVYWDTPHTWTELLKQEKNYAIAQMQIHSVGTLFRGKWKTIFSIIVILILFAGLFAKSTRFFSIFLFGTLFSCFLYEWRTLGTTVFFMKMIRRYYRLFLYIRYCRYFSKSISKGGA